MNCSIVTTSIYEPTPATLEFCKICQSKSGWEMIVVGDLKTPEESYRELEKEYPITYLSPKYQEEKYKELSDAIGWNKIMRRNIGFVEAYEHGSSWIVTVDDDNIPYIGWERDIVLGSTVEVDNWTCEQDVIDPLSIIGYEQLWHRGFPLQYVKNKNNIAYTGKKQIKVDVQVCMWDGDPDIDAVERIGWSPCLKMKRFDPFTVDKIAPFNSQNTIISREMIPYYMVLPHVGRMDDIWGGYLLQMEKRPGIIFTKPNVYQDRNYQNLITNLKDEVIGYEHTLGLFEDKDKVLPEKTQTAIKEYREAMRRVA